MACPTSLHLPLQRLFRLTGQDLLPLLETTSLWLVVDGAFLHTRGAAIWNPLERYLGMRLNRWGWALQRPAKTQTPTARGCGSFVLGTYGLAGA